MEITPENVNDFIPDGYRLRVHHNHAGNNPSGSLRVFNGRVKPYSTFAFLVGDNQPVEYSAWAFCSKKDSPRRITGWKIAVNRLFKKYHEAQKQKPSS